MKAMLHVLYFSIILALMIVIRTQDHAIVVQRLLIKQMVQNPSCLIP